MSFLSIASLHSVSSHVEAPACRNKGGADGRRPAVVLRREGEEMQCPKGVFRNRGKMEENRYSLVAGKSRVERAERGRTGGRGCRDSVGWKREIRAHPYRGSPTHSRFHTQTHTQARAQSRTTLRLGLGKTIPGKTPKIRRYETTWEILSPLCPSGRRSLHPSRFGNIYFRGSTRVMRYARFGKLHEYGETWTKVGAKTCVKFMSVSSLWLPKIRWTLSLFPICKYKLSFQQNDYKEYIR